MKYNNSKEAKKAAIKEYKGFCIVTGQQDVVGAHLYPAGAYQELKSYSENIIPISNRIHTNGDNTLDWIIFCKEQRPPMDRIFYILEHVLDEYRHQLRSQLRYLAHIMGNIDRLKMNADMILLVLDRTT